MLFEEEVLLGILDRLGARQKCHSGRTLYDHLFGTYTILRNLKLPEFVCSAGLFHSIYGTFAFDDELLSIRRRDTLQKFIGQEAEKLVFLNSALSYAYVNRILERPPSHFFYINRWDDSLCIMTREEFSNIVILDFANRLEILASANDEPNDHALQDDYTFFLKAIPHLTPSVADFGKLVFGIRNEI